MGLFNVRVYGLLFDSQNRLLVSDERIKGKLYTKLPGGGLEFGEGTRDCLKREFLEETGLEISVLEHIYTTDFFQISAFNPSHQIISIYYKVTCSEPILLDTKSTPFDFRADQLVDTQKDAEIFRWVPYHQLHPSVFSLPIDKIVIEKLLNNLTK
ncbi:MAG: NUDIX domain-containing protein [Sediminibacterium sp.]|jgi:ADP-ribose pyrophosphatase YjhB (NUDIX family)|nr:NUDIX domain-containing protein [Sediminibacterium sp.]